MKNRFFVLGASLALLTVVALAQTQGGAAGSSPATNSDTASKPAPGNNPPSTPNPSNGPGASTTRETPPRDRSASADRGVTVTNTQPGRIAPQSGAANSAIGGVGVGELGSLQERQAEFARLDINGDSALSANEVRGERLISANFSALDTDNDGRITGTEFSRGVTTALPSAAQPPLRSE